MYADISKPPPALPQPNLQNISAGLSVLPPLTRCKQAGPGVIILVPDGTPSVQIEKGVPSLSLKWAEEGYAVAEVQASYFGGEDGSSLKRAVDALKDCAECSSADRVGLIGRSSALSTSRDSIDNESQHTIQHCGNSQLLRSRTCRKSWLQSAILTQTMSHLQKHLSRRWYMSLVSSQVVLRNHSTLPRHTTTRPSHHRNSPLPSPTNSITTLRLSRILET